MSETLSLEELDYYAQEDAAIERIGHELANEWHRPDSEILDVMKKLKSPTTIVVEGEGYKVVRDMDQFFKIVPDKQAENTDLPHAA